MEKTIPLMVIDMQKAFDDSSWGVRNNPNLEKEMEKVIRFWREKDQPIFFVKHVSDKEDSLFQGKGKEFMDFISPQQKEYVIEKKVNSAFIETNLEEHLKEQGWNEIIITGLTTNHCVETTTRMASNLGFSPIVVSDLTATFNRKSINGEEYSAELVHEMSLANLKDEFAKVIHSNELLKIVKDV
ncbi:cysteine hydrolase family protein [Bacillus carboniphilus]|uniref:Cysteine hydrolase family protein n=1 Tax=Bacillus carboniphilus TaxID=86663 RepID=A0ABY9JZE1_9BACI|nr:cysteine hydrolase family protein [Bacillus carboniphilus]WLR43006.1 cysteine hydrolase family protein [Bacillus carboniphilus]